MNAEVTLRTSGCADHLRLFWQAAESLLEQTSFGEDPAQTRFNILVSIQEAVSNVLRHGYAEGETPKVELGLKLEDGEFVIELRDWAQPFDPTQVWAVPDTSNPEAIPEGGYGILMMREVLDELQYERVDDQNVLTMRKVAAQVTAEG